MFSFRTTGKTKIIKWVEAPCKPSLVNNLQEIRLNKQENIITLFVLKMYQDFSIESNLKVAMKDDH